MREKDRTPIISCSTIDGRHGQKVARCIINFKVIRSSLEPVRDHRITGQAIRIHHIRGGRAKPDLCASINRSESSRAGLLCPCRRC